MNRSCNKIILVEDNPADVELIRFAFRNLNFACDIIHCSNGGDLFNLLEKTEPEAFCYMLLDLNIPRLNGIEILKNLSTNKKWSTLPIIIFTSSSHDYDIAKCYELGANAYVLKPVLLNEFDQIIHAIHSFWGKVNFRPVCVNN
jgi:two-component system response regulator